MMKKKKVTIKHKIIKTKKSRSGANFFKPIIIVFLITIGVMVWYSLPRPVPTTINVVGNPAGKVDLKLTPSTLDLVPNQEATITLEIAGGTSHITTAQVEIAYDAAKIGVPTVSFGTFLSSKLEDVKTDNNKIQFTLVAPFTEGGVTGSGVLATIQIKPLVAGSSALSFTEGTTILATEDGGTNILKSVTNASIEVKSPTTSPSPSPSASPSLSPSPSPSSSPSPSAPNSPQKPNKPTGLRSNCFDGGNKITLRWDSVTGVTTYKVRLDQKDGSGDISKDDVKGTEFEAGIKPDQKYAWWVHAVKDGVDSEEAKINKLVRFVNFWLLFFIPSII